MRDLGNAMWRKSTRSGNSDNCVEVATDLPAGQVGVRDSKDTAGPTLTFQPRDWQAFIAGARDGAYDLP